MKQTYEVVNMLLDWMILLKMMLMTMIKILPFACFLVENYPLPWVETVLIVNRYSCVPIPKFSTKVRKMKIFLVSGLKLT